MYLERSQRDVPDVSANDTAARLLEELEHGVALLDVRGQVVHQNRVARELWPHLADRWHRERRGFTADLPDGRSIRLALRVRDDGCIVAEMSDVTSDRRFNLEAQQWSQFLAEAPALIAVVRGPEHVYEFVNPAYCAAMGRRPEELIAQGVRTALPDYSDLPGILDQVQNTGNAFVARELPSPMRHAECEEEAHYTFVYQRLPIQAGEARRIVVYGFDVTQQVRARRAAEAERVRLLAVIENVPAGIVLAEAPSGRILLGNSRMEEILGRPLPDLSSPGGDAEDAGIRDSDWPLMRALRGEAAGEQEVRVQRPDGSLIWVGMTAAPIRDADGAVRSAVLVVHDIDVQKKAEAALTDSERQFRLIAEAMPQLVWRTKPDGYHDYFNQRWYDYTGTHPGDTSGELWSNLLHPDDRQRTLARWHHSLRTGEDYEIEYRFRRASDGMYRWFLGRAMPLHDSQGRIGRWFGTCTDIHDQKESEAALRSSNDELEQFAYAVSHDLQEPLRMLLMYGQLLKRRYEGTLDSNADLYINYLIQGAHRLEALLSDLRSYIRMSQAKGETLAESSADAGKAFARVVENLGSPSALGDTRIEAGPLPMVAVEPLHLEQLLQNLLSNAMKYRGEQPLEINVSAQRAGGDWVFSVTDNGIGIDPRYARQIFGIFKRLHGQRYPGTGMGLAICQKIVERYGGRIWVESEPGRGSTFFFTLPANAQEAQ